MRFSYLVVEQPWIKEIDINPLLVSPERMIALDARVVLHDPATQEKDLPRLAIRPYPNQYVSQWKTKDDTVGDHPPDSARGRAADGRVPSHALRVDRQPEIFLACLHLEKRIAHERLTRICFTDYDCEIPLVVDLKNADGRHEILGVGRLNKVHGLDEARFAIVISDAWQSKGLGTQLLNLLINVGRQEKLSRITGSMLPENDHDALHLREERLQA